MVEFLNNWKLNPKYNKINVMLGKEQKIVNKHMLVEVLKICHIGKIEAFQVEMSNVKVALADITNKVLNTYNTNKRWIVKKMKLEYANRNATILLIIYQKDKV
jgi:hypothetical protein